MSSRRLHLHSPPPFFSLFFALFILLVSDLFTFFSFSLSLSLAVAAQKIPRKSFKNHWNPWKSLRNPQRSLNSKIIKITTQKILLEKLLTCKNTKIVSKNPSKILEILQKSSKKSLHVEMIKIVRQNPWKSCQIPEESHEDRPEISSKLFPKIPKNSWKSSRIL